ncbi:MAG TPA: hypothetical protein VMB26_10235 [Candidatus Binataceae bacterium]|nr:hypothetical protein [Candidatus Binataceae bacterium]
MVRKRIALVLSLSTMVMLTGARSALAQKANGILCGRYTIGFSASILPSGLIAGTGAVTSDCRGNLVDGVETINVDGEVCEGKLSGTYSLTLGGTGTVSFTLIPRNPTVACPIVTFTEAIAVGQNGDIVKAVNTTGAEVTIQEEWVRQEQ